MNTAPVPPQWKALANRRRNPDSNRETVLKTPAHLFQEKSCGRSSMNDAADCLNTHKPALYHYFRNKEEILVECDRHGTRQIEGILNEILARCGSGMEKAEAFISSYANVMTVNFGRCVMRLDDSPEEITTQFVCTLSQGLAAGHRSSSPQLINKHN